MVSVCAGRCETELQASKSTLVICLDIDKRSLYAGAMVGRYLHQSKNVLFHPFNMGSEDEATNLLQLIHALNDQVVENLDLAEGCIHILFQHPSPSRDSRSIRNIAVATHYCCIGFLYNVSTIDFVYDENESGNTWTYDTLCKVCSLCTEGGVYSRATCISETHDDMVDHPTFGKILKSGWAKMKSGREMTFRITKD